MRKASKRLAAIAAEVEYKTIADIGTDHCYLPIYMAKNNLITKAIACDMNEGPLQRAKANVLANNCSDVIELRKGYGLSRLGVGEVEAVILSGMGGCLVIEILTESLSVVKSAKQLILQPQRNLDKVRDFLHTIGFEIKSEAQCEENNKQYTIMNCRPVK